MSGIAVLDDAAAIRRYDRSAMFAAIAGLPGQIEDAWATTRELDLPDQHRAARAVVVLGMGGSAIGADLVAGVLGDRLRVPVVTSRSYDAPAFVGPETLVVASSHSGATEETLSAFTQALGRGAPAAAITTGGPLREAAVRGGIPLLAHPGGGQPRASVGQGTVLLAGLLERAGMLALGDADVEAAVAAARDMVAACGPDVPAESNPAKRIAFALVDRLPVIEAGGYLIPVARRWKTQINENAKSIAAWEELPEATHNTVVGYELPESLHERTYVVFLAGDDHPRVARRMALSAALLDEHQVAHETVTCPGGGHLAQAFAGIVLGDFTSAYLAILYGRDPTPVPSISWLKEQLAASPDA